MPTIEQKEQLVLNTDPGLRRLEGQNRGTIIVIVGSIKGTLKKELKTGCYP